MILTIHYISFSSVLEKKYSTSHAIIPIVERINTALIAGKYVAGVFLDFRKAYGTFNHSILLKKIHAYGIHGNILDWFKSYLNKRESNLLPSTTHTQIKKNFFVEYPKARL